MSTLEYSFKAGALLSVLTFIHFFVDWVCQSHEEAMSKHGNAKVRARHCAVYTAPFLPFLWWVGLTPWEMVASVTILFWSHFFEDSYIPVLIWAKYLRRPPSMQWRIRMIWYQEAPLPKYQLEGPSGVGSSYFQPLDPSTNVSDRSDDWRTVLALRVAASQITVGQAQRELDTRGFLEFIDTTLGKILMIAVDQIIHICFLWPIIWMCLN